MDGLDLGKLLGSDSSADFESRLIFAEAGYGCSAAAMLEPLRDQAPRTWAVRRGRFKLYYDARADPEYVLFDLVTDPGEKRDASSEHPELRAELTAILEERLMSVSRGDRKNRVELDPEVEARLRELGYIN